jgi:hypothetical protein
MADISQLGCRLATSKLNLLLQQLDLRVQALKAQFSALSGIQNKRQEIKTGKPRRLPDQNLYPELD